MKLTLLLISFLFVLKANSQADTIPPVITMNGADTLYKEVFSVYTDPGATAFDLHDGVVQVTASGTVNTSFLGIYAVTYNAVDSAGNAAPKQVRIIHVRDVTAPVITLVGANPFVMCNGLNTPFTDPGAFVTDNYYKNLVVTVNSSSVNVTAYGTYPVYYTVTDPSGNRSDTVIRLVKVVGNCASGLGYLDKNKNCSYDAGESKTSQFELQFRNTSTSQTTVIAPDNLGSFYAYTLDTGNYMVKVISFKPYIKVACSMDSFSYHHTSTSTFIKEIPFLDSMYTDLWLYVTPDHNHRWNTNNSLFLYLANAGTSDIHPANAELIIPNGITILSSSPAYDSISANKVYFSVDSIHTAISKQFYIVYKADTSVWHLNDSIPFAYSSTCGATEIDMSNNSVTLKKRVVGSYDPNEKTCSLPASLSPGVLDFKYSVMFQNTGNAEAYNVQVNDTIDSRFDLTTLNITEASHRYRMSIQNNVLMVRFEDIFLPDSHTNESKSHGFFSYSVKLKKALVLTEEIKNTAYIYFDNNPAIVTNTTVNRYGLTGINTVTTKAEVMLLYPNPAHNEITILNLRGDKVVLYDLMGKELLSTTTSKMDISSLPKGVYIVKLNNSVSKLVKE